MKITVPIVYPTIEGIFVLSGIALVAYLAVKNSSALADIMGGTDGHLPTSALGGPAIYSQPKMIIDQQHHGFQGSGY